MFGLGSTELIVILLIILLVFGGKKLPELAKGLGKGIAEFKKAKDGVKDAINDEINLHEEKQKLEDDKEDSQV